MKKITLLGISILMMTFSSNLFAQNSLANQPQLKRCASTTPSAEWDAMFNQLVEKTKQASANEKTKSASYVVPIIFHIIYGSEPVGTYPNLAASLINSQMNILNTDYAGMGYNTNKYVNVNGHLPFYDYAVANSLPAPDNAGVIIANTGITFILATKDPSGNLLAEPGIDRESYVTNGWTDPASINSENTFTNYIDNTIKPATIWDATKYFNVWLTDCNSQVGILGYSTFPSGTSLQGLSGGGSGNAQATTDGCWVLASSVGNSGSNNAPYNLGRTLTHESGHYFGLRHVWGDGNCLTDYCNDIPKAYTSNYVKISGSSSSTLAAYPYNAGTCPSGSYNNSTDGEMFMNFMDYSDDAAMWMFTTDQVTRMSTALSQSPDRSGLTASANAMTASAGLAKVSLENFINVYPNPVQNNQINISVNLPSSTNLTVSVQNILGQEVYSNTAVSVTHQTLSYNLPTLPSGIYMLVLTGNNHEKVVKKIIVE